MLLIDVYYYNQYNKITINNVEVFVMLKKFNDKFNSLPKGVQFVLAIGAAAAGAYIGYTLAYNLVTSLLK